MAPKEGGRGVGGFVSVFLRRLDGSMPGSSSQKHPWETLWHSLSAFQVCKRKDHINLNTASKKNFGDRVAGCFGGSDVGNTFCSLACVSTLKCPTFWESEPGDSGFQMLKVCACVCVYSLYLCVCVCV